MKRSVQTGAGRLAAAFACVLAASASASAQAPGGPTTAMDGRWHYHVTPYMWFTGIAGDLSVASLPSVPVEMSFSDIWDGFDFGLQGHFEGRKDRFGFGLDVMYTNLGAPVAPEAPLLASLGLEVDVRQVVTEGFALYRAATGGREDNPVHLDLLAGVRYVATRTRLAATGPTGEAFEDRDSKTLHWVDALAGARVRAPLGSRVALIGRGDVAGLGSKLTWNVEGDLAVRASQHWTVGAGWRHLDIEYDEGEGRERRLFDIAYDGPRVWFNYAW